VTRQSTLRFFSLYIPFSLLVLQVKVQAKVKVKVKVNVKVKVKLSLSTRLRHKGGAEVYLNSVLTSTLDSLR